jgi:hypothetical protein
MHFVTLLALIPMIKCVIYDNTTSSDSGYALDTDYKSKRCLDYTSSFNLGRRSSGSLDSFDVSDFNVKNLWDHLILDHDSSIFHWQQYKVSYFLFRLQHTKRKSVAVLFADPRKL